MLGDAERWLHLGGAEVVQASLGRGVEVHRHRLTDVPAHQFLGGRGTDELVGLARIGHPTLGDGELVLAEILGPEAANGCNVPRDKRPGDRRGSVGSGRESEEEELDRRYVLHQRKSREV